jgi:hypothetical protein
LLLKVLKSDDNDKAQKINGCIVYKVNTCVLTAVQIPVPDSDIFHKWSDHGSSRSP